MLCHQRDLKRELVGGEHLRLRTPFGVGEAHLLRDDRRHQRETDMKRALDLQGTARRVARGGFDLRTEAAEIDEGERVERAREKHDENDEEAKKFSHGSHAPPAAAWLFRSTGHVASSAGARSANDPSTRRAPAARNMAGA